MVDGSPTWHLLPHDLIELQIGQIDLLMAMYPDEIHIDEYVQQQLEEMRIGTWKLPNGGDQPGISLRLELSIIPTQQETDQKTIVLDMTIPLTYQGLIAPEEPPNVKVKLQQSTWMNKATTTQLTQDIPSPENLLSTIDFLKDASTQHLDLLSSQKPSHTTAPPTAGPLVRVWFYFPSISTRSKRDDFIIHAPSYSLTGFLYAGKPGLLCVEGGSQSVDDYMRYIKTESWGDIPAHHKKVSERYRENLGGDEDRVFKDMQEITDVVGKRRGQRANRADMKAVEEWLGTMGLGEALGRVLM
ncbi:hypothetical protein P154DRAFT_488884 [Amniculicola lignicola CBS 123094]|uniref:Small nuclear ribonucleoprotein Prp3 C-terminal domain-containing protein n=1 Tax=Amniculicola lignicola CBS 123094 TaxID=1392246 RepID=A0A6A5WTD5_9PLEO|nr:hypothetical protein P154DRAFT_488884 [Amniculicola lignicola CBS 123094]